MAKQNSHSFLSLADPHQEVPQDGEIRKLILKEIRQFLNDRNPVTIENLVELQKMGEELTSRCRWSPHWLF